jgi:superfamily II DNA/RNA helicase
MSLYQRRVASSAYAIEHSLKRRARRLREMLQRAEEIAETAPPTLPTAEELEEMEETEREQLELRLEAVTLTRNRHQVLDEVADLEALSERARAVQEAGAEAKLSKLHRILQEQGFFDDPDQRLLIFTEFKDTLDYLRDRLKAWGFRVGMIHGGMKAGTRDQPGTRLWAEQQFWDGTTQVMVATEAARCGSATCGRTSLTTSS